jgi:hypothetical protein
MAKVVNFYKGLPSGAAPAARSSGYQARHFDGNNASMAPVFQAIGGIFLISYTIDYQFHLSKLLASFAHVSSFFRVCVCVYLNWRGKSNGKMRLWRDKRIGEGRILGSFLHLSFFLSSDDNQFRDIRIMMLMQPESKIVV